MIYLDDEDDDEDSDEVWPPIDWLPVETEDVPIAALIPLKRNFYGLE